MTTSPLYQFQIQVSSFPMFSRPDTGTTPDLFRSRPVPPLPSICYTEILRQYVHLSPDLETARGAGRGTSGVSAYLEAVAAKGIAAADLSNFVKKI